VSHARTRWILAAGLPPPSGRAGGCLRCPTRRTPAPLVPSPTTTPGRDLDDAASAPDFREARRTFAAGPKPPRSRRSERDPLVPDRNPGTPWNAKRRRMRSRTPVRQCRRRAGDWIARSIGLLHVSVSLWFRPRQGGTAVTVDKTFFSPIGRRRARKGRQPYGRPTRTRRLGLSLALPGSRATISLGGDPRFRGRRRHARECQSCRS
jgi:hypothetical protein